MPGNEIDRPSDDLALERLLATLRERVARWTGRRNLVSTDVPDLFLFRREEQSGPETVMYEPSICILVQGAKRVYPGGSSFVYDQQHFLVASVDIPTVVEVISATPEEPCLGIVLGIDRQEISQLVLDGKLPQLKEERPGLGISAGTITPQLLDAVHRLIALLDEPEGIPILAPVIRREILYRLLTSDQGARLRQIATAGSRSQQISQAIDWMKENFAESLRIEDLATKVNMSPSTFHHHFRDLTARSPLQYQKWLRLNEARRLMLVKHLDASAAAYEVGYESASHFSREYRRLFGDSPLRDIARLREEAGAEPN